MNEVFSLPIYSGSDAFCECGSQSIDVQQTEENIRYHCVCHKCGNEWEIYDSDFPELIKATRELFEARSKVRRLMPTSEAKEKK